VKKTGSGPHKPHQTYGWHQPRLMRFFHEMTSELPTLSFGLGGGGACSGHFMPKGHLRRSYV